MSKHKFKGTGTALITPFDKNGKIDFESLGKVVHFQIAKGIDYLVILGTTGESVTLSPDERKLVTETIVKVNAGRVPLVLGIGGYDTKAIIQQIKNAPLNGIDAILSVSPYYNKPSQEGIYQHFAGLAGAASVPLILYNVPSRTGSNIEANTTLSLANDFNNIIGIKEASGNFDQCMEIIERRPDNFLVVSGEDMITLPLMSLGFDGVISVISNAFPAEFSEMVRLAKANKFTEARTLHYKLKNFISLVFEDNSPAGIKYLMSEMELCKNELRLPLVVVNEKTQQAISKAWKEYSS